MEIKDLSDNLALTEKQKKKKQQESKESQQIWSQMFFPFIYSVKKVPCALAYLFSLLSLRREVLVFFFFLLEGSQEAPIYLVGDG